MPTAIAIAAAEAIGTVWAAEAALWVIGNSALISQAAFIVGSISYGKYQQRKAIQSGMAAYRASLKDRELTIRSAIAPRRYIYGRDRVGGQLVYAEVTGDKKQFLHLVLALAAHECEAIEEVWFGDVILPAPDGSGFIQSGEFYKGTPIYASTDQAVSGGNITLPHTASRVVGITYDQGEFGWGTATGWSHTPGTNTVSGISLPGGVTQVTAEYEYTEGKALVRIKKHLGAAGQTADSDLVAESDGKWTTDHKGTGICYLYVRLEWDKDIFGAVGIPEIKCVVKGRRVLDTRTSTTAWNDNAALVAADWLKRAEGMGATSAQVPASEVTSAANICDEEIDLNLAGTETQVRYTFNGSFTSDMSARDVLQDIAQAMAGSCVWVQGRWLVRPGAHRTPASSITPAHLAGPGLTIIPKMSRTELFNAVRVTYRDLDQGWAEVSAPLVTNALYETEDGGVQRVRTIQIASAMDHWRAQRLGKIELERGRQAVTAQFQTSMKGYDLVPTDTVPLAFERYGWGAGKVFEIQQRTYSPDGTVSYEAKETAAEVWDWNYGEATLVDPAPDTALRNPYIAPDALTGLAVASGTAHLLLQSDGTIATRAYVTWNQSSDGFVLQGGRIELEWHEAGSTDWMVMAPLPGDAASAYVMPVADGTVVMFRVRQVNAIGRASVWAYKLHEVIGKSEPPSDVANFVGGQTINSTLPWTWDAPQDIDYAYTEVRANGDSNWGSQTNQPLFRGRATVWHELVPSAGIYIRCAKHFDTSGNESLNAVCDTATVNLEDLLPPPIIAKATPFYIIVTADQDGNVTDDFTGDEVELSITVDGVETINSWTLTPTGAIPGFTWTITGSTFALTGAPDGFTVSGVNILAERAGYPDQTISVMISQQRSAGTGTPVHRIVLTPRNASLTADQNGVVNDWTPAQSDITVVDSAGSDVTAQYTFTKTDTNVVSTLSGALNNHLTVTGWDPAAASTAWGNTVLQMPLDGDAVDVSQYQRQSIQTFAGVTFVSGGFNGRANFDMSSHNARITVGPYSGFLVAAGTPWSIRCRVEFNALTTNFGEEHYLCGNAYKGIVVTKASGAGQYTWRAYWIGNGNTFTAQSVAGTINTGQIYLVEASYGADGHLRLFLDGVQVGITSSTNTTTPDYVDTTSQTFDVGAAQPAGNYNTALNGKLDDLRYVVGAGGSNNAYTPENYPLPVGAYVTAGHVDITAAHATLPDLTDRFSVSTVTVAAAPISSGISPSTITLQADWQGVVASFSGASAVLSIMVNGTEEADTWSIISTTSHASITYSKSGRTITLTGFPSSETNGYIDFNCSKAGRASQVIRLGIVKVNAAQPIVIASAPSPVIVAGATDGTVPSANLPVAVSAVARQGATDVTSSYSWSVSATSGITVTNTGAAASITAMATNTDTGTLTWTGTRTNWPTLTCTATVSKTRAALPSGAVVAQMVAYAASAVSTDPATAIIKYSTDGRILIWDHGGSAYTHVGNWYNPTTTSIGNTHYIRMTAPTVPGDAAGPFNAWTALSSDREYTMTNPATTGASTMTATALISTSSTGASIAGQGPVTLTAERFGS